jgi:hypothetical protein
VIQACGQFVVLLYEGNVYPGKTVSFKEENAYMTATVKNVKPWRWPEKQDTQEYENGVTR